MALRFTFYVFKAANNSVTAFTNFLTQADGGCILSVLEGFQRDVRALSLGAASAQIQVAAPARRKTLRGDQGGPSIRLALMRLRRYATLCGAKAQVGEKQHQASAHVLITPLGLPEGAFYGELWTPVIHARGPT